MAVNNILKLSSGIATEKQNEREQGFLYGNTHTNKCKPCEWVVWEARKGRWHSGAKNTERQEVSRGFSTEHHENTTAMWNHLMLRLTPTHTYPAGWHAAILFSFSFLSCCCLKRGGGKHCLSEWTKKKTPLIQVHKKKATCKVRMRFNTLLPIKVEY